MPHRIRHQLHARTLYGATYRSDHHGARRETVASISRELGPCIYAMRTPDNLVKIGFTGDVANRFSAIGPRTGILGVMPGTYEQEQQIHSTLRAYVARGVEYYHPTPAVLAVANSMRERIGFDPIEPW